MLAPILYNMKHAIEIFIKTLFLFSGIEPDYKHDLSSLFKHIKIKIKKLINWKKLTDLETIIKKYYECEIIKNKIKKDLVINDCSNDVFRYPRNMAYVSLDFSKIFSKFTKKDVSMLRKDIKKLDRLFYDVGMAVMKQKINSAEEDLILIKKHPSVIGKL